MGKYRIKLGLKIVLPNSEEVHSLIIWERGKFPKLHFGLLGITAKSNNEMIFVPYSNLAYIIKTIEE